MPLIPGVLGFRAGGGAVGVQLVSEVAVSVSPDQIAVVVTPEAIAVEVEPATMVVQVGD